MSWNKAAINRVLTHAHTLDKTRLIMLVKMMSDEIIDNLDLIEEFTRAYSILRDVVGKSDNYKSISDLFRKAAGLASTYPDSGWMLSNKASGKVAPKHKLSDQEIKRLSEELAELMNKTNT